MTIPPSLARLILAACSAQLLCSCGSPYEPAPSPVPSPVIDPELPPQTPVPKRAAADRSLALSFVVDPARSVGTIATTLDPEGVTLGPRQGHCKTPLQGTIKATLLNKADGSRHLHLTSVDLSTTQPAKILYEWNALLGKINCTIPTGELKITDHKLQGPLLLDADHKFHAPHNQFCVKCPSTIEGSGLVLKKAVGTREANLDIPVTETVLVQGSCTRHDGEIILTIPGAVLRDHYDLGDATLDLVFTGDIVATSPAP